MILFTNYLLLPRVEPQQANTLKGTNPIHTSIAMY